MIHSLDGEWEVQLEPGARPRTIRVPFTFEAPLSGIGAGDEIHEQIRYRRTFRVPDEWHGRTLIHFGAVDWRATVSLDGVELGTHEGGYTHFVFDAGQLAPGSEHELVVEVFDPADDAFGQPKGKQRGSGGIWYTRTTGIWQSVWLANDASPVPIRRGTHPYTGVPRRKIEIRARGLVLNGHPLRIAGVLDQGFWPDGGYTPPSDDALRADVEAARAMGFNLVRKHVKVEDPRWYAWCDALGMLVAQDLPSSHDLSTAAARERLAREWAGIIEQLSGHPSIVMWIVTNEDWGKPGAEFQRELVELTRRLDPTRLVVDASGWTQLGDTDLVDVHDYGAELTEHVHARDDIPLWFGELGGITLALDGARSDFSYREVANGSELVDGYRRVVEQIPEDVAGFVWTQLTDVEGELNGLLTADRRPKVPFDEIRRINEEFVRG